MPSFHITWGTGPGVIAPFVARVQEHVKAGRITLKHRYRATALDVTNGAATGVTGDVLRDDNAVRGASTNRDIVGGFSLKAGAIVVTSGGIGGNHDLVRKRWPTDRLGTPPAKMVAGVPEYVDGQMTEVAKAAGAGAINEDRMWHYTEGLQNWDPIWPNHGIRILPGPSSLWFDALGNRMEAPFMPGFDTLGTLKRILQTGHGHSWFILTQSIIKKEFALSGSEQNPDLTSGKWLQVIKARQHR